MAFTDYSDLQVQFPANYIQDRFNFPQEIGDQEIADKLAEIWEDLEGQQLQALVDDHTFEWNSSRTKYFLNLYDINKEYETDIRSIFRRFGGVNNIVGIKIKRKKTDDV